MPDDLQSKTDQALALLSEGKHPFSAEGVLVEKEWQRRERVAQHEMDLKLMARQIKAMRFAAIVGVAGTLAGGFLGAYLQNTIPEWRQRNTEPQAQEETATSAAPHRTEKAGSIPSPTSVQGVMGKP